MSEKRDVRFRATVLTTIEVTGDHAVDVEIAANKVEACFKTFPMPVPGPTRFALIIRALSASLRNVDDVMGSSVATADARDTALERELAACFVDVYGKEKLDALYASPPLHLAPKS